jgi:Uma2 family endonuclease
MAEKVVIRMTMQEFIERFEEQPFELINGEIWEMSPVKFGHSQITKVIYDAIYDYLKENPIGEVFPETAFVLEDKSDWVEGSRVPDVMYIEKT